METNEIIMLIIGIIGLIVTFFTWITGKKNAIKEEIYAESNTIKIYNFNVEILLIFYIFILIMMLLIGFISGFFIPTIVGGIIALIPLLLFIFAQKSKPKTKVKK